MWSWEGYKPFLNLRYPYQWNVTMNLIEWTIVMIQQENDFKSLAW